ncbi:phosphoglycerate mutase-like protein [Melanomma pulvis-pyrius CBS 109.77]|uniref:Phosphoglycerate mutase-like protein n=1 Tax=Melanomma pulvis-pyrius CBS 109.77 TaxID=1314802 RepID=A0A6A6WRL6_9PLEO|nr:phosphoglycerate mutase-like protein [Melanomma pulvis-pyrius CBS 109.77]
MSDTQLQTPKPPLIHIIRHGESLHNIEHNYPHRDPPLTSTGHTATRNIAIPATPDLLLISPMTRTIQTALNAFPFLQEPAPFPIEVQIWPALREAHDAICNVGVGRAALGAQFPQFDFSRCPEEWDHGPTTREGATARAEEVRVRLKELSATYANIVLVTHRGFIAFLVKGRRFDVCDVRSFRFATGAEAEDGTARLGLHCEILEVQDFGPTLLVLHRGSDEIQSLADVG